MAGGNNPIIDYRRGIPSGSAVFSTDRKNIEPVDSNDRTQPINSTAYLRSIIDELTSKIVLLERKSYIRNAHALSEKESLIGDLEKFKKGIEKGIDESNKKIQDQDSKITNQSNKNIEILALFATFFTFISVNVQVFSNLKNLYQSLIFVFFFGLILISFLMLFFSYTRDFWIEKKDKDEDKNTGKKDWRVRTLIIFIVLLFASGAVLIFAKDSLTKETFLPECENLSVEAGPRDCLITKEQMSDYLKNSKKDSNKN
jgi:hypothetical protein